MDNKEPRATEQAERCNLRLCCRADEHVPGCTTYDPNRYPDEDDTRQAAPEAPTPIILSGLTKDRVLEIAKQHFGWVGGLGGFDDAVLKFSVQLAEEAKSAAPEAPTDDAIEQAALKHVATGFKQLAAVSNIDPDYRKGEQFKRLKAFALELFGAPAIQQAGASTGRQWVRTPQPLAYPYAKATTASASTLSDAEFLSKRLARVAKLAGVTMPSGTHEDIAAVAGTILGSIAFNLERAAQAAHAGAETAQPATEFDRDEFMRLVREFSEVVYGVRRTTEDVGANLVNYVKSLIGPVGNAKDCDTAFDAWYAAQRHQLTNEQVCRLIWQRGWQAHAAHSGSDAVVNALRSARAEVRELQNNLETFGPYGEESARVAIDGALDVIDEHIAAIAASQPQKGSQA